jgi:hypothetical protein
MQIHISADGTTDILLKKPQPQLEKYKQKHTS